MEYIIFSPPFLLSRRVPPAIRVTGGLAPCPRAGVQISTAIYFSIRAEPWSRFLRFLMQARQERALHNCAGVL